MGRGRGGARGKSSGRGGRSGGRSGGGGKKGKKPGASRTARRHAEEYGEAHPVEDTEAQAPFREHAPVVSKAKRRREAKQAAWAVPAAKRAAVGVSQEADADADADFARLDAHLDGGATSVNGSAGKQGESVAAAESEEDEDELDVAAAAPVAFDELVGLLGRRQHVIAQRGAKANANDSNDEEEDDDDDDDGWAGAGVEEEEDEGEASALEDELLTEEEAAARAAALGDGYELVAVGEDAKEQDAEHADSDADSDSGEGAEETDSGGEMEGQDADAVVAEASDEQQPDAHTTAVDGATEEADVADSDSDSDASDGDINPDLPEAPPAASMGCVRRLVAHFEPSDLREGVTKAWREAFETPATLPEVDASGELPPVEGAVVSNTAALLSAAEPVGVRAQTLEQRLHRRLRLAQLPSPPAAMPPAKPTGDTDTDTDTHPDTDNAAARLTPTTRAFFECLDTYRDVYATQWTWASAEELRLAYVLHGVNHALRARDRVLRHTRALARAAAAGRDLEHRDQGFAHARVVFMVPFRHQALKIVGLIEALLIDRGKDRKVAHVRHKKKFAREFGAEALPKPHPNMEYRRYFEGNIDDCFALGLTLQRHSVNLYADLHKADIIIASPLGLRRLVGAEGDAPADRDYDFLSAAEVVIVDQADVMQMQNLEHLKDVLAATNLLPRATRDTDITRVRHWALDGCGRHFRQTAVFSAFPTPELNALMLRGCHNLSGRIRIATPHLDGSVRHVLRQVPQLFQRLDAVSPRASPDAHFAYFMKHVVPTLTSRLRSHVLVVVPSYFDFVRVRNQLKRDSVVFAQICEYTTLANVTRARNYFYHGERRFMLYTERFHFHQRPRLRNVKHIVFYQPPLFPQLYAELVNSLTAENGEETTVTVLYSRFDALRLARIVGSTRAERMLASERDTVMFL